MNKKVFTGMLAAIMAVSSSFMSFADSVNLAPGQSLTSGPSGQGEGFAAPSVQNGDRLNAPGEQAENIGSASGTVTAGGAQSQSGTVTAGGAQSQSGTVTAGGAQSQSGTVTAGGA